MMDLTPFEQESMEVYKDSFNMLFGTSNKTINLFDNPYIEFKVYEFNHSWVMYESENIKLRKCQESDMQPFLT